MRSLDVSAATGPNVVGGLGAGACVLDDDFPPKQMAPSLSCLAGASGFHQYGHMTKRGRPRTPPHQRFIQHITFEPNTGCWLYTLSPHRHGYCVVGAGKERMMAHRFAYASFVGPIPEGMEIDHICGVRSCCNPSHLKLATRAENADRRRQAQKHCKNGHAFTKENTYIDGRGWRSCHACREAATARYRFRTADRSNGRKTHCKRGHEFTNENTRRDKTGRRYCRACRQVMERVDSERF